MQRASSQRSWAISFLGQGDQAGALGAQLLAGCEACWPLHLLPLDSCTTQNLNIVSIVVLLSQCPAQVMVWFWGSVIHVQSRPTSNQGPPHPVSNAPVSPRLFCSEMRPQVA